jgi:hypothetical protein
LRAGQQGCDDDFGVHPLVDLNIDSEHANQLIRRRQRHPNSGLYPRPGQDCVELSNAKKK